MCCNRMSSMSSNSSFTFLPVLADTSKCLNFSCAAVYSPSSRVTFLPLSKNTWRQWDRFYWPRAHRVHLGVLWTISATSARSTVSSVSSRRRQRQHIVRFWDRWGWDCGIAPVLQCPTSATDTAGHSAKRLSRWNLCPLSTELAFGTLWDSSNRLEVYRSMIELFPTPKSPRKTSLSLTAFLAVFDEVILIKT